MPLDWLTFAVVLSPAVAMVVLGTAIAYSRLARPFLAMRLGSSVAGAGIAMAVLSAVITGHLSNLGIDVWLLARLWMAVGIAALLVVRAAVQAGFTRQSVKLSNLAISLGGAAAISAAVIWLGSTK